MAEITKELGRIPVSRGDYQATTEYYKDNIVQYKRGSYQVVSESPIIGVPPTNDKNVVNPGWTLFAGTLDAQDVVNQIKEQEAQSIQAIADREAEILAKSDAAKVSFDNTGTSLSGTNVQDALKETNGKISELESEIGKNKISKTYTNADFSGLIWGGPTDGWLSAQFHQKDSIIIKVTPSQSITWNNVYLVSVFGYEPKIGVKTDKLFYVDGKLDYTNTTGSDVWLYFLYDKSATVNLSIEFSSTGILNDIDKLQKEDTFLHKSISDEIERASSEEANINANIISLNLRVGNKRESKVLSNADFANIIWGGETDGWLRSNSSYNAIIIEVYPQQTIDWSASTTSLARVFDYKPEIGKKIKYIDTIDGTQSGAKKDYTNLTEQVMYLYMVYNLPITLNLPITILPSGIFGSLENLETALDSVNYKIGEENSTKEYTSEDTSGLLWGGTSDGWLNDAYYSSTSYIIELLAGSDLLLTDIVGEIRQKYVFNYNPKVGDKGDKIASFDGTSYSNTTDKTLYVCIGFSKEPGVTLTAQISASGIRKEIEEIKESISLKGTTIVCIGDSLTEFKELSGNKFSYPDYIREITKANVINIGIGGTRFSQRVEPVDNPSSTTEGYAALDMVNLVKACCTGDFTKQESGAQYLKQYASDDNTAIVARAKAIDWSKVDVVTILGGANDWTGSSSGSYGESGSTNRETTLGAINVIVDTLLSAYPHLKIFFFTTCFRYVNDTSAGKTGWSDDVSYWGKTLKEFAAMTKNEFELNHIPVCDLYNTLGWNKYNYDNYYVRTVDYSHPYKGFYNIARRVVAFLQANRNF